MYVDAHVISVCLRLFFFMCFIKKSDWSFFDVQYAPDFDLKLDDIFSFYPEQHLLHLIMMRLLLLLLLQEDAMADLQQLAPQLPWSDALEVWRMNNSFKKRRGRRRPPNSGKPKRGKRGEEGDTPTPDQAMEEGEGGDATAPTNEKSQTESDAPHKTEQGEGDQSADPDKEAEAEPEPEDEANRTLKFRVTCNRAGDKHSFTSNDAARDFGGAVQEHFLWKADMTKFDVEVR